MASARHAAAPVETRRQWKWLQVARHLWVRAAALSFLAAGVAVLAIFVEPDVPARVADRIDVAAVRDLLNILAASMLSVTIFSLSTIVAAHALATSSATPRATQLLHEDQTSQNALATFVGSFIFSLLGIILLQSGVYDERGRVSLYLVTLLVIAVIVATLLRWIDHVSSLGWIGAITHRVEQRTAEVLLGRRARPCLGGHEWPAPFELPDAALPVHAREFGYVQHVDVHALHRLLEADDAHLFIVSLPGIYSDALRPLAWVQGSDGNDALVDGLRHAFTVSDSRTFDQDPRFGITVLAEIAARALSPATNDPGTAIDVIGRMSRLLAIWAGAPPATATEVEFPRVRVPRIQSADLIEDAFTSIARDGAGIVEVAVHLQKSLRTLAALGDGEFRAAVRRHAALALRRAELALDMDEDLERVREIARGIHDPDGA